MKTFELLIDVTDAANLGEDAFICATVQFPDSAKASSSQVVCFAKPGAGFSRKYFTIDLPGPARGSQAEWHTANGWIFIAIDHLGVGESSCHHDPARLTAERVAAANHAAEQEILTKLIEGELSDGFPAVSQPVVIGIGQSMGGFLTVFQQGRYHDYDGIGILGFSAVNNHPPTPPGEQPVIAAWRVPRGDDNKSAVLLNKKQFSTAFRKFNNADPQPTDVLVNRSAKGNQWFYYYEDVLQHLEQYTTRENMPWLSSTIPGLISSVMTPGLIAPEAAAIDVPVLMAAGERDVVVDPKGEPGAYLSSNSVDTFVCPRMAHMHNFAGTRTLFWQRIHNWGEWVKALNNH